MTAARALTVGLCAFASCTAPDEDVVCGAEVELPVSGVHAVASVAGHDPVVATSGFELPLTVHRIGPDGAQLLASAPAELGWRGPVAIGISPSGRILLAAERRGDTVGAADDFPLFLAAVADGELVEVPSPGAGAMNPAIQADGDGFVVSWEIYRNDGVDGVGVLRLDAGLTEKSSVIELVDAHSPSGVAVAGDALCVLRRSASEGIDVSLTPGSTARWMEQSPEGLAARSVAEGCEVAAVDVITRLGLDRRAELRFNGASIRRDGDGETEVYAIRDAPFTAETSMVSVCSTGAMFRDDDSARVEFVTPGQPLMHVRDVNSADEFSRFFLSCSTTTVDAVVVEFEQASQAKRSYYHRLCLSE